VRDAGVRGLPAAMSGVVEAILATAS